MSASVPLRTAKAPWTGDADRRGSTNAAILSKPTFPGGLPVAAMPWAVLRPAAAYLLHLLDSWGFVAESITGTLVL